MDLDVAESSSLSEMDWGCLLGPHTSTPDMKLEADRDADLDDVFGNAPFGSHLRVSDSKHGFSADGVFDLSLSNPNLEDKFSWMLTPPGAHSLNGSFRGALKATDSFATLALGLRSTPPPLTASLTEVNRMRTHVCS